MSPVSVICLFCDPKRKASHPDSEALRSPMMNLNYCDTWRKNIYIIVYVCIVLCAHMCINAPICVFFSLNADCTSSLGRHRRLAQGTLLLCKKLCVRF